MSISPAAGIAIIVVILFFALGALAWFFHSQVALFATALLGIRRGEAEDDGKERLDSADDLEGQKQQVGEASAGTQTGLA